MLRITTESIGNNKGSADRICKEGSYLHSFRKSADFCLEEKSAGAVSVYEQKRLADLSSPEVKSADMERNVEGTVLQEQKKERSCRLDYQHVSGLSDWLVHCPWP
jgi:hypothetical protein